jgi:uncharacterized protein
MNSNISEDTCKWLTGRMEQIRPRELKITFFGGEPLMNIKSMEFISKTLYEECQKRDIILNIEIITNGLLLTPELIKLLLPFGLQKVKVTLDGDQKTHDRMRPLKSSINGSKGTYYKILDNLSRIKGLVPITIGGNYDDKSKYHIPKLLDDLKEMGFKDGIKEIAFKPILGFINHEKNSEYKIKACSFSDTNVDDLFFLIKETEKRDFTPMKKIALGPCEAVRENSFSIDPSGEIYKCAAIAGRKQFSIGNVNKDWNKQSFDSVNVSFMTSDAWKNCLNCKFLPLCGGGCRLEVIMNEGSINEVSCEKEYFEKVLNKLIISEI